MVELGDQVCTLPGEAGLEPGEVLSRSAAFRCGPDNLSEGTGHIWIVANVPSAASGLAEPVLRMRPGHHGAVTIHVIRTDGSSSTRTYSEVEIAGRWRAPDHISFPLSEPGAAPPATIIVGIDEPWDLVTLFDFQLLDADRDMAMHWKAYVAAAFFCGVLFAPFLMSILFYTTVRQTFILYYAAMVALILTYVVNWTGMIFDVFPDMGIRLRSDLGYLNVAGIVLCMALVVRSICEPDKLGKAWRAALLGTSLGVLALGIAIILMAPMFPNTAPELFHVLFAVPMITIFAALASASLKGSRYAQVQLVGWGPTWLIIMGRVVGATGLIPDMHIFDIGLYPSLLVETLVTSGVIIARSRAIWREHKAVLAERALLQDLASTDPLTGLLNRRAFEERFEDMMAANRQSQRSLAFAIIDVDHFKAVNDTYGHAAGDDVLTELAGVLSREFSGRDLVARFGGEEFCLLIDASNPQVAEERAETFRSYIAQRRFASLDQLTVSIGLTHVSDSLPVPFSSYYLAADAALYAAKAAGRNRMHTSSRHLKPAETRPREKKPARPEDEQAMILKQG